MVCEIILLKGILRYFVCKFKTIIKFLIREHLIQFIIRNIVFIAKSTGGFELQVVLVGNLNC